jgi:hypothetical protein
MSVNAQGAVNAPMPGDQLTGDQLARLLVEVGAAPNQALLIPVDGDGCATDHPRIVTHLDVWGLPGEVDWVIARLSVTGRAVIRRIRASGPWEVTP